MTEALSWPRHLLTLEDWEALPEDNGLRLELAEGVLMMSPRPVPWHQNAVTELTYGLKAQLPASLIALAEVEVVLSDAPLTIRVPDVTVTSTAVFDGNPPRYRADDVSLVVEVLSEGTRRVDRVLKSSEYADAGIGQYWIVDLDAPTTLTAYVLVDGEYELAGEATGNLDLTVAGNPVRLDLESLTRR
ncbi:Uma2 family endonuclease [Pseudonocardia sp. KRD291]|uniref:Uma2 family endonuclease n=1 Tax=Pseudonocardia sp. KRD291 TaxID=2792007 RepID=UPI001C4A3535|nr:Uma2 family endonuclease [Pseudonocardia sp. KRD291]MBW0105001.1 Uma2 family endonuclease [Pseudonocardia sp. KRD291]